MDHPELAKTKADDLPTVKAMQEFDRIIGEFNTESLVTKPSNPWLTPTPYIALAIGLCAGVFFTWLVLHR